jgi:hypothetical protein
MFSAKCKRMMTTPGAAIASPSILNYHWLTSVGVTPPSDRIYWLHDLLGLDLGTDPIDI